MYERPVKEDVETLDEYLDRLFIWERDQAASNGELWAVRHKFEANDETLKRERAEAERLAWETCGVSKKCD